MENNGQGQMQERKFELNPAVALQKLQLRYASETSKLAGECAMLEAALDKLQDELESVKALVADQKKESSLTPSGDI